MGHIHVVARIRGTRSHTVRALVDTGSTFLVLPRSLVSRLGLPKPIGRETVELGDGSKARLPQTTARVQIDGREAGAVALIIPKGEPLIGIEVLEALGLTVDPMKGRLIPKRPYAVRLGGYRRLRSW
jgi:clan AA aspartic protease